MTTTCWNWDQEQENELDWDNYSCCGTCEHDMNERYDDESDCCWSWYSMRDVDDHEEHTDLPFSKDFRGEKRDQQRFVKRQKKYWSFRDWNAGQQNAPHYIGDGPWGLFPADLSTAPVKNITKREFFDMAQGGRRPPTYKSSRHKRWTDGWEWTMKRQKRMENKRLLKREVAAKKNDCNWREERFAELDISTDVAYDWYVEEAFQRYCNEIDSSALLHEEEECDAYDEDFDTEEGEAEWFCPMQAEQGKACEKEEKEQDWVLFDYGDDFSDCGSEFEVV